MDTIYDEWGIPQLAPVKTSKTYWKKTIKEGKIEVGRGREHKKDAPEKDYTASDTHCCCRLPASTHTHTLQRGEWVNSLTLPILKGRGCMDNISLNKFSVTERIILNLAAIGECRSKKISLKHPLRPISPSLDESPLTDCIYGISTWWMPENRQWFNQDYSLSWSLGAARAVISVNHVLNNRQNSTGSYESTQCSALQLQTKQTQKYDQSRLHTS